MENQKPDYYINQKRKTIDFLIGFVGALLIWFGSSTLLVYIDQNNYGEMGFWGLVLTPVIIAVAAGIWLFFKPRRRQILLGMFTAAILPAVMAGSCLIPSAIQSLVNH